MATDIVPSLFGVTPDSYRQAQQDRADAKAMQFVQLDPFQQANYAIGRGAYGLAGAVGGALGGQDPELQRISMRQQIAGQIDYGDPQSLLAGGRELARRGDIVGAMQAADVARKLESEMAQRYQRMAAGTASLAQAARERTQATPEKIQLARELASRSGAPGSPEYESAYDIQLARLTTLPEATTPEMRNAAALALQAGSVGSPEYTAELQAQLTRLTTKAESREPTTNELTNARSIASQAGPVGSPEYNAAFMAEYNRLTPPKTDTKTEIQKLQEYATTLPPGSRELTQVQAKIKALGDGNKVVITNQMPGDKALADIPAFRAAVQRTIEPQLKAVNATDQALQAINDSLATGNFASYRAAQTQFARAISGAGDLSQRELKAAGADPSLLGGTADYLSSLFTSTPTADTQKKIRNTLEAIRTVATKQARSEVEQQRKIALRSPGYNVDAVTEALTFSELAPRAVAPVPSAVSTDLAAQATAELARRAAGRAK